MYDSRSGLSILYRVVGVVPFPVHERSGAAVDAADVDALRFPQPGWVDVQFWDELVFKALDEPDYEDRRTFGLSDAELADLDIYIKTTAPEEGVSPISEDMLGWWRQAIPEAVREITGEPWRGRITTGVDSRELTDGRINVGIGTEEYFADRDARATPSREVSTAESRRSSGYDPHPPAVTTTLRKLARAVANHR